MRIRLKIFRYRSRHRAFSLVEEVVAMGLMSTICISALSSLTFAHTQRFRDREAGIVSDFLTHYLELLKALPFEELEAGRPVNALYDGNGGGPRITIPASGQWVSLTGEDYSLFHPDLAWLAHREPELRLSLATADVGGEAASKHIKLEVKWDQPLSSRVLTNRLDMVRVKDL